MVAESSTLQGVLGAADAAEAAMSITTYSEDNMSLPRVCVLEQDVTHTSEYGQITGIETRMIGAELFMYVPSDFNNVDPADNTIQDEHSYVLTKFGAIMNEIIDLVGTNGHLQLYNPKLIQPERMTWDERFDTDEVALGEDARSVWFGILGFQIS